MLTKLLGDKKEWKSMEARAAVLPRDYRIVYDEIKKYMWRFTSGDGMDIVEILKELLVMFESAAAQGKAVLEVTGDDVAAFCDEHLRGAHPHESYLGKRRTTLNQDVHRRL
ncbi:MAG TPA: DUF1048 domain-containing protein [Candidatus Nanopelagicales bacterium]